MKIALDIGHGEDTWTVHHSKGIRKNGKDYEEHHSNAKTAILAEARLKELGFEIVMAQQPYKADVPLRTRTNFYDAQKVDLIVSIHSNAGASSANGISAFHWHTSTKGKKLAETIMKHIDTVKGVDVFGKGVIPSVPNTWTNFHMCREPKAPSVLMEFGFMTNPNDFEYIFGAKSEDFHTQCAEMLVKAICEYSGTQYKAHCEEKPVPKPNTPEEVNKGNYKVNKDDTFYSIAKAFGISVADIERANPTVKATQIKAGQYIVVPEKKKPVAKPKYTLPNGVLRKGDKGADVKLLQTALNALKFNVGKVDGAYGQKTEDAVKRFQKIHDALNVDGVYGSRTKSRMNQLLNK